MELKSVLRLKGEFQIRKQVACGHLTYATRSICEICFDKNEEFKGS